MINDLRKYNECDHSWVKGDPWHCEHCGKIVDFVFTTISDPEMAYPELAQRKRIKELRKRLMKKRKRRS